MKLDRSQQALIEKVILPSSSYLIKKIQDDDLSDFDIDMLCELLNNEQMINGIDKDFNFTAYGFIISDIIDTLNHHRIIKKSE